MKLSLTYIAILTLFGTSQINCVPLEDRYLNVNNLALKNLEVDPDFFPNSISENELENLSNENSVDEDFVISSDLEGRFSNIFKLALKNLKVDVDFLLNFMSENEIEDLSSQNDKILATLTDYKKQMNRLQYRPTNEIFKEEEVIDILKEIWSKVPMDKLMDLIIDYLFDDKDFQSVVKYMMGDEFKKILLDIEKIKELKALLKYLNDDIKMDVYKWLNEFHALIGLDERLPMFIESDKITGGLPGLIKDIRALLPIDELYKYFDEKLKTSKKFKEFVKRLQKKELQNAVNALGKHKGFNSWLKKLQDLGVDLDELAELIGAIIGIKFPKPPQL